MSLKHILISRADNIGDVILTLPLAGILKQHFPSVKITLLARDYVRAIAENCIHIDAFESWDALSAMSQSDAISRIQQLNIDAVIHAFPKKQIATLIKKANVPVRIGTSRRFYHWFTCNKRINFSRKKSDLHEAQLNLKLLSAFNVNTEYDLKTISNYIGLHCSNHLPENISEKIKSDRFNLIIHPFSNGNTREWPVSHFIELIQSLPSDRVRVIITGSQKENARIESEIMPHCPTAINFAGQCDLTTFITLIAHCDGLVANSTGPLHIAAALGIHALGLFPITKGMDIKRWAPIGAKAEVITADANCQNASCVGKNDCVCMESITVEHVKNSIINWLKR
jgi:ADP-heptose:LPS heptosyltransferase